MSTTDRILADLKAAVPASAPRFRAASRTEPRSREVSPGGPVSVDQFGLYTAGAWRGQYWPRAARCREGPDSRAARVGEGDAGATAGRSTRSAARVER